MAVCGAFPVCGRSRPPGPRKLGPGSGFDGGVLETWSIRRPTATQFVCPSLPERATLIWRSGSGAGRAGCDWRA